MVEPGTTQQEEPRHPPAAVMQGLGVVAPRDPVETLSLVKEAGLMLVALQDNAAVVNGYASELLVRTREERARLKSELEASRTNAQHWQQRALAVEAGMEEARSLIEQESLRRNEAEMVAVQAIERAKQAEQQYQELEEMVLEFFGASRTTIAEPPTIESARRRLLLPRNESRIRSQFG